MKKVVKAVEVDGEGLEALLDEYVVVFCMNFIYSGRLHGVNSNDILLQDACIVYETGALGASSFQKSEKFPGDLYLRTSAIESYYKRGF